MNPFYKFPPCGRPDDMPGMSLLWLDVRAPWMPIREKHKEKFIETEHHTRRDHTPSFDAFDKKHGY